jgi:hypothetical protein
MEDCERAVAFHVTGEDERLNQIEIGLKQLESVGGGHYRHARGTLKLRTLDEHRTRWTFGLAR